MDTQVIVVGAGPVGLMLAGELRLGGAEVVVFERLAAPTTESRASTLHARTMEILDQRGLLAELGNPPSEPAGHFGGIPLDLSKLPTPYPGQWKVPQARVEQLLASWAGGLGADIRRDHEVLGYTADRTGVRVAVSGPAAEFELRGRYLVGCDGEDSTIARLCGMPYEGSPQTRELLRADVLGLDIRNRRFERLPAGLAIASTRNGVTRVMMSPFEAPTDRVGQPDFAEVCAVWQRLTGEDISHGTPTWLNAFGNVNLLASAYQVGRILLAGDAAHRQMPAGGQAINLGLQDAVNLGWKLAATVRGCAPPTVLDSYHTERHEIGRQVLSNIAAQALLLLGDSTVDGVRAVLRELVALPAVRDKLAAMVSGLDVRYGRGWHPLIGARLPHLPVGAGLTTTALLRPARGLLLDLSGDADRGTALRASAAGRLDVVPAVPPAGSPLDGLDTVLVRPDGYVAWASDQRSDPAPAVRRWFGDAPVVPVARRGAA